MKLQNEKNLRLIRQISGLITFIEPHFTNLLVSTAVNHRLVIVLHQLIQSHQPCYNIHSWQKSSKELKSSSSSPIWYVSVFWVPDRVSCVLQTYITSAVTKDVCQELLVLLAFQSKGIFVKTGVEFVNTLTSFILTHWIVDTYNFIIASYISPGIISFGMIISLVTN